MSAFQELVRRVVDAERLLEGLEKEVEAAMDISGFVAEFREEARRELEAFLAEREKALEEEARRRSLLLAQEIPRRSEAEMDGIRRTAERNMEKAVRYVVDTVLGGGSA